MTFAPITGVGAGPTGGQGCEPGPLPGTIAGVDGGRFEHRIRCVGGPLDGRGYLVDAEDPAPDRVVTITGPDGAEHTYMRLTPRRPLRPGDAWEYIPLPAGTVGVDHLG